MSSYSIWARFGMFAYYLPLTRLKLLRDCMPTVSYNELPAPPKGKTGWPWTLTEEQQVSLATSQPFTKKISIVTPSYNQGHFLEETIRSILLQGCDKLEFIIMDGGSTDNSVEVIKKYEQWIDHWESTPDRGQTHAINKGLERITGDIFNWLNSDDYFYFGALRKVADAFDSDDALVVGGQTRQFGDGYGSTTSKGTYIYSTLARTIGWCVIDQPATFFATEAIDKMGHLTETMHFCMDREWWVRFLYLFGKDRVTKIAVPLVNFRLHGDSKTVAANDKQSGDRDTIFYAIARQYDEPKIPKLLEDVCENELVAEYEFPLADYANIRLIRESLHYFVLLLGNEFYEANKQEKAAKCFEVVDKSMLAEDGKELLKKLKFRNNLPGFIISIARSLTR